MFFFYFQVSGLTRVPIRKRVFLGDKNSQPRSQGPLSSFLESTLLAAGHVSARFCRFQRCD